MTISQFVTVEWAPASEPASISPTWVDITGIVMEVEIQGGRSGVFDLYGPRTATIRCRNGTKSPAVSPTFDVQGFYRWRQIRVLAPDDSWPIFTGYILSVTHDQTNSPFHGEVVIECTDIMGILAQAEFSPSDVFGATVNGLTNASQLTDAVTEALTLTGVDPSLVNVNYPSTAWYKLPDEPSGQILSWLQSVMEGEAAGGVQITAAGLVWVNGRYVMLNIGASASTPFLTFTDTTPGVDEYKYLRENLTFASTDSDYYNRAVAKSTYWDTTFTWGATPGGYPKETISRTDLPFVYQSWAEANARLYALLYSTTATYPRSLNVYVASAGATQTVLQPLVAATATFGLLRVVIKHTPAGDTQQTYEVTVESCRHTITPELWKCELGFASLDRWIDAYGDGTNTYELVAIGGDSAHGVGSDAIIAP